MYLTHCRTFSSIHHTCIYIYIHIHDVFRTELYLWDGPPHLNLLFYCVPSYFFLSLLSQPDTQELTDRSVAIKLPPQTLNSLTFTVPMVALAVACSLLAGRKNERVETKETVERWFLREEGRQGSGYHRQPPGETGGTRTSSDLRRGRESSEKKGRAEKKKESREKILVLLRRAVFTRRVGFCEFQPSRI